MKKWEHDIFKYSERYLKIFRNIPRILNVVLSMSEEGAVKYFFHRKKFWYPV